MFQIMVVEDDAELRELFCTVFSDNGYTPIPAGDGLEAFDILERAGGFDCLRRDDAAHGWF